MLKVSEKSKSLKEMEKRERNEEGSLYRVTNVMEIEDKSLEGDGFSFKEIR